MSEYVSEQQEDVNIILCPPSISPDQAETFNAQVKNWGLLPVQLHILNFEKTNELNPSALQPLMMFHKMLKADGKHLYAINMKAQVKTVIKEKGLLQVFNPVDSITEAKKKCGLIKAKKGLDVGFINPFLAGTKDALSVQAGVEINPAKPFLKGKSEIEYKTDIAGVISLISEHFTGSITLCFPTKTFLGIYNTMFDESNDAISDEIADAAGEILNIIYGTAKAQLNDSKGYSLQKAIPTVLRADNINVNQTGGGPVVVLPFTSAVGPFHIEIEANDEEEQQVKQAA